MRYLILIFSFSFLLSCKKKEEVMQPTPIAPSLSPSEQPSQNEGSSVLARMAELENNMPPQSIRLLFIGKQVSSPEQTLGGIYYLEKKEYVATAATLSNTSNSVTYRGDIWINDSTTIYYGDGGYYYFLPSTRSIFFPNEQSFNLKKRFHWKLAGDAALAPQEFDMPIPFPDTIRFAQLLPDTLYSNKPFTVQLANVIGNADSIRFTIAALKESGRKIRKEYFTKATAVSHVFSASDIASVKGDSVVFYGIEVSAYKYRISSVGTKLALFMNRRTVNRKFILK